MDLQEEMEMRIKRELATFPIDDRNATQRLMNVEREDVTARGVYPDDFDVVIRKAGEGYELVLDHTIAACERGGEVIKNVRTRMERFLENIDKANRGADAPFFASLLASAERKAPRLPIQIDNATVHKGRFLRARALSDILSAVNLVMREDNRIPAVIGRER